MITTDAPAWLRRSDQAVTWARTMLLRDRAVVIDCETTDLPGGVTGNDGYQNLRNSTRTRLPADGKTLRQRNSQPRAGPADPRRVSRQMHDSCIGRVNSRSGQTVKLPATWCSDRQIRRYVGTLFMWPYRLVAVVGDGAAGDVSRGMVQRGHRL